MQTTEDKFYDELTKSILASYDGKKFSTQELLSRFIPEEPKEKKTYTQNWSAYNQAQTKEKLIFFKIIYDIIESIREIQEDSVNGRPRLDIYEIIKALCYKSYNNHSSRRTVPELQIAKSLNYLQFVPHFNTLSNYLNEDKTTLILQRVIHLLALPFSEIEEYFAVDATGFSQPFKKRWVEVRLDKGEHKTFRKLHAICGIKTNIITKAIVTEGTKADSPYYEDLVLETAKIFNVKEVLADAGYLSRKNCQIAFDVGAIPYIMPKKNTKGRSHGFSAWNQMIWLWKNNKALFKQFYHKRSNVEASFSAMKRKFGSYIRSKNSTAQNNEVLLKVICYNASILIRALLEFDLNIDWLQPAQKPRFYL